MMARKSKIDEDCEELSVVADPWNLKLKPAKLKGAHLSQNICYVKAWRLHDTQDSISHRPRSFVYR